MYALPSALVAFRDLGVLIGGFSRKGSFYRIKNHSNVEHRGLHRPMKNERKANKKTNFERAGYEFA